MGVFFFQRINMENKLMQVMSNMAYTENGALRYKSTHCANLDFFALAGGQMDNPELSVELFEKAFKEDPNYAIKNLFYIRDCRGGQGVRSVFYACMNWLFNNVQDATLLLKFIPEYGSWKDLFALYEPNNDKLKDLVIKAIVENKLKEDIDNMERDKPVSLCAKWFPIVNNTRNPQKRKIAKDFYKLFGGPKETRKMISKLREYINVTERNICKKEFSKIQYSEVPSKSLLRNKTAFTTYDNKRFTKYLERVNLGKEKINTKAVYPFELILPYLRNNITEDEELIETMWKNLPDYTNGTNALCMVDVSGSMSCNNYKPLAVAVSLGLYFAERNNSPFKNHFLTFSEHPELVQINPYYSLFGKISHMKAADWSMNTNINLAFKTMLEMAKRYNVPASDMPKVLYIISDMEFDIADRRFETNYDSIKEMYSESGYELPHIVFWNVAARDNAVPINNGNDTNTTLVSGYSPMVFKYVLEGKSPVEFMEEVLNSERYTLLEKVVS